MFVIVNRHYHAGPLYLSAQTVTAKNGRWCACLPLGRQIGGYYQFQSFDIAELVLSGLVAGGVLQGPWRVEKVGSADGS